MKIDFDEEKHEYSYKGEKIPSVSEILSPLSADRYGQIDRWILNAAADKGKAVHEATQLMDYGADAPEDNDETSPYLFAYLSFLLEHDVEWELIEQIVPYCRLPGEDPLYCGTVDRYGTVDGVPAVLDIKTYASMSTDAQISASCQTQLYADAIENYNVDWVTEKRYLLHLRKDGSYRLIDLANFDSARGFNSKNVAWRLYELNRDLNNARKRKGKK